MTRQRSFGPSNRGNYSDAETCLCQGHFVDAHTALLHRGAESDLDNHPRLRHCPYSDCESEFEPHYLEQTSSGNVFIPGKTKNCLDSYCMKTCNIFVVCVNLLGQEMVLFCVARHFCGIYVLTWVR